MRTLVAVLVVVAIVAGGCATTGSGPSSDLSDEEQIAQLFMAWKAAYDAMDEVAYVALYSDSYEDFDGMGKDVLEEQTANSFDERYNEEAEVEINIDGAEVTVTGDTARFMGIKLEVSDDAETFGFALKKEEDGVWRIVGEAF